MESVLSKRLSPYLFALIPGYLIIMAFCDRSYTWLFNHHGVTAANLMVSKS
jgi:hypothetical protein